MFVAWQYSCVVEYREYDTDLDTNTRVGCIVASKIAIANDNAIAAGASASSGENLH